MKLLLNIDVPDLVLAQVFYLEAFGWTPGRRLGDAVLELVGPDIPVYLLCKEAGTVGAGRDTRDYHRHWTPLHGDLVVTDLDAALSRAIAAGAWLEGGVRESDWGRIAQVADPFGHGWCLIQFSEHGYGALEDHPD